MIISVANKDYSIEHIHSGEELFQILAHNKPKFITYDTETTGLHVKADKPFKGAICFKNKVYLFDTTYDILKWMPKWFEQTQYAIGHNMPFDLNMSCNIIGDEFLKNKKIKYLDTMNLVSLASETQSERRGGVSLKLKKLATQYIDVEANKWEIAVKKYLKELETVQNRLLTAYIKGVVIPNQEIRLGKNGKPLKLKTYTRKQFDELQKTNELPPELQEVYDYWLEEYKEPTYDDVPPEILDPYLAVDVILTALLAYMCLPIIEARGQLDAMKLESSIIPTVVRMARVGMDVDHEYLAESKINLEGYIRKCYEELWEITEPHGFKFNSGQHPTIKNYYSRVHGIELESTDSDHLEKIGDTESKLITKLRTLEKWLSTYIVKIQRDCEYDGRFYSLFQPFKAVTGRFSGDAQQFPKFPLMDDKTGEEIYFPRRAFKGHWVFADFSQQELRVACHYALSLYKAGHGVEDMNLFRAYMPYKCRHYKTGEIYDKSKYDWAELRDSFTWEMLDAQMKLSEDKDPRNKSAAVKYGWSAWYTEDGEAWTQTDLHSATALQAIDLLGLGITPHDKEFKKWRNRAKTVNFGKLYGSTWKGIQKGIGVDKPTAIALDEAYYKAFPSLKVYAEMIEKQMRKRGYVNNLYSRKYYMTDPSDFYRCGNMIIQGSCAYDVKAKMVKIQDYLDSVEANTQIVLTVHDEIVYSKIDGEEHIIKKCVEIMENSDNMLVPLVSEQETTETTWADKQPA
jgi:DNA polymerase-1